MLSQKDLYKTIFGVNILVEIRAKDTDVKFCQAQFSPVFGPRYTQLETLYVSLNATSVVSR